MLRANKRNLRKTHHIPPNDRLQQAGMNGFTLIEVLLALAIIAIALTALLKATGDNIRNTQYLNEKRLQHWVAMQGLTMVQLGLVTPSQQNMTTMATTLFGKKIFWRIQINPAAFPHIEKVIVTTAMRQSGPFKNPLTGFRYV